MIKLLGIPYDANSSFLKGPSLAPGRIRLMEKEGSANSFSETGIEITNGKTYNDLGDIFFTDTNAENAFRIIKENIKNTLGTNEKILCLGGIILLVFLS
jgi:arginase family enzyme